MEIKRIVAGVYAANCYLVYDKDKGFIIDPGGSASRIIEEINELNFTPEFILLTHGHCDHIGAVDEIRDYYNIPAYIHVEDEKLVADKDMNMASHMPSADVAIEVDGTFKNNEIISPDKFNIKVIHTPGHTAGCSCFLLGENIMFTGDTVFAGSIGRTDLPSASQKSMEESIEKIKKMDDNIILYPGHGTDTTIAEEKKKNKYFR